MSYIYGQTLVGNFVTNYLGHEVASLTKREELCCHVLFLLICIFFLQGKAIPQASSTYHLSSEIERAKHFIEDSLKKASARVSTAIMEGQTLAWSIWLTTGSSL